MQTRHEVVVFQHFLRGGKKGGVKLLSLLQYVNFLVQKCTSALSSDAQKILTTPIVCDFVSFRIHHLMTIWFAIIAPAYELVRALCILYAHV